MKSEEKPARSFNAGELSPDFAGRVDVKQYYSGALAMKGIEPVPQGGFRLMAGTHDLGPARTSLVAANFSGITTDLGPNTGITTIWEAAVDSGTICMVDLRGVSVSAGTLGLRAQVFSGGTWTPIMEQMHVGQDSSGRTFAFAPGAEQPATRIRIVGEFSQSATATIDEVTAYRESVNTFTRPRYRRLRRQGGEGYFFSLHEGFVDIWKGDDWVAAVRLMSVTEAMLPDVGFYAEDATVGIFHGDLQTLLIRRVEGNDHEWQRRLWAYENIPTVDYGGTYAKTDDVWEIFIRWAEGVQLFIVVDVNGEQTPAIQLQKVNGDPAKTDGTGDDAPSFSRMATQLQAAINALPSVTSGVTVTAASESEESRRLTVTFAGEELGKENQLTATIVNTTAASAVAYHTTIGETADEALISFTRGWPGLAALVSDRLAYGRFKGQPAAVAFSMPGEYFNLNIKGASAGSGRLDRLRSETSETVLAIQESKYVVLFTNANIWFATNRVISGAEPLNFIVTSEIGIRANCEPVELEGRLYYVANNGGMVLSAQYDELQTSFMATPETIVNSHLVIKIARTARQELAADTDASRMWMMREDGRLIQAQIIRSQEILGLAEWRAADGGLVREIATDTDSTMRLCMARDGRLRHERMVPECLFQQAVETTTDLSGLVTGLPYPNGTTVWAEADGYILGPFTVAAGQIDLEDAYSVVTVGRWRAPLMEDMPRVLILPNDTVVWRPGRIHTASLNVMDTTSIAIGANGEPVEDVPLLETGDPVNAPMPGKSKLITVTGILGAKEGTTLTITQLKPGRLRVRDYSTGEKL